ncbi:MAG: aspartate--tRNA ligase, partial [Chloroflexi bacterium]|nr:aspartate--tRNA ligase [Chloroflexota bacterium]
MLKTHTCGQLRAEDAGTRVSLAGWVHRRRDHGGLMFVDLRDRWGITQVVFNPDMDPDALARAERLRNEYVVRIEGEVRARPEGLANANLATGEIEVVAGDVEILNESKTPVFYLNEEVEIDEALRLRYRYL